MNGSDARELSALVGNTITALHISPDHSTLYFTVGRLYYAIHAVGD